jgi:uncharacterized membrane protein YidH (DUF202 family)
MLRRRLRSAESRPVPFMQLIWRRCFSAGQLACMAAACLRVTRTAWHCCVWLHAIRLYPCMYVRCALSIIHKAVPAAVCCRFSFAMLRAHGSTSTSSLATALLMTPVLLLLLLQVVTTWRWMRMEVVCRAHQRLHRRRKPRTSHEVSVLNCVVCVDDHVCCCCLQSSDCHGVQS